MSCPKRFNCNCLEGWNMRYACLGQSYRAQYSRDIVDDVGFGGRKGNFRNINNDRQLRQEYSDISAVGAELRSQKRQTVEVGRRSWKISQFHQSIYQILELLVGHLLSDVVKLVGDGGKK